VDGYGIVPLAGGWSGETFLGESAGERTVVRIYARRGAGRGHAAVEVDAAVLRLVRGLLPVPEVLEVRRPDPGSGTPGLLVTSFLPGERLDVVLPRLDPEGLARAGRSLGEILARLALMPTVRSGSFVDGDLRIEPLPAELRDLVSFVEHQRTSSAISAWQQREYDGLLAVADLADEVLAPVGRTCLVHSDLNPKNVLMDPDTLAVTGLVDWEFAYSGAPVADVGNLLRFDRAPAWTDAVLSTYSDLVPDAPGDHRELLDRARAADLFALVELAGRRGENPVTEHAHDRLRAIVATGDLHAAP
jgi:aminoglycoside phosphotransferase (APT) family kinase protein